MPERKSLLNLLAYILPKFEAHDFRLTKTHKVTRLNDDVVFEIFSYLDPFDAARAGRVCAQWSVLAARAAYSHVLIDTASSLKSAYLLARTLLSSSHLRALVRYITKIGRAHV